MRNRITVTCLRRSHGVQIDVRGQGDVPKPNEAMYFISVSVSFGLSQQALERREDVAGPVLA